MLAQFLRRFLFLTAISLMVVWVVSELAYRLIQGDTARPPKTIELVIPLGTAERIAAGEPPLEIPSEMIFVVGDTLLVVNQDRVEHTLGPVWVPAGSSASLRLDTANDYVYTCSFQPSQLQNITVKQSANWKSRLAALWYGTPPTVMFLLVYSLVMFPLKKKEALSSKRKTQT